jgi:site-specific recombinase XerD
MLAGAVPDDGLSLPDARRIAEAYREELARLGVPKVTVDVYSLAIRRLLASAEPSGTVDRASIRGWSDDLFRRFRPRTAALYGVAVRQMLKWAADNGECSFALAGAVPPAIYNRTLVPQPLSPENVRKFEAYLSNRVEAAPGVRALRDRALFSYMRATAARVGEALQVRRATFERQTVRQSGRSPGEKTLAPPPGVVALVREYLAARTDGLDCLWIALYPTGKVKPLTDAGVGLIWHRHAAKAGVPRFKTYQLRHTAGVHLVERGRDLDTIREYLGTRRLETVQRYRDLVPRSRTDDLRADLDVTPR